MQRIEGVTAHRSAPFLKTKPSGVQDCNSIGFEPAVSRTDVSTDMRALLGQSQVRFSAGKALVVRKDPDDLSKILSLLDQKYVNGSFDVYTLGDILKRVINEADNYNRKAVALYNKSKTQKDVDPEGAFSLLLTNVFKINNERTQEDILQQFSYFNFIRVDDNGGAERIVIQKAGRDAIEKWDESLKQIDSINARMGSKLTYMVPPVDLRKLSLNNRVNKVDFAPETWEKIKEKLKIQSAGSGSDVSKANQWLNTVWSLPWLNETVDNTDTPYAKSLFESRFYGMEVLKERLLDEISVRASQGGNKGGIILIVGPPGTGKTAVTSTLADMLGRRYARVSLAGVSDAQKINGHDYTYVGSKYGMIIDAMMKAGTKNPVLQIDEIDKAGQHGSHGNPLDALLAVLDPQQNDKFTDSYLEFPFDLSKVLFICTANSLKNFPTPLLSRTEVIYFDAYLPEEKIKIAEDHLLPKQHREFNIPKSKVTFEREAITHIINNYTSEGGVRKLEQQIQSMLRKATRFFKENPNQKQLTITPILVDQWLTNPVHKTRVNPAESHVGMINGLYYSENGGGILPVQVSAIPGKGIFRLTGKLGETMQESAQVAYTLIKEHAESLGLDKQMVKSIRDGKLDIHIHYPDGATPKDGPSAGTSTFLALWSALSKTPIPAGIALTGEIDIKNRVLPIGGILEKLSGAKAQGVERVYLPEMNRKNFNDYCKRSEIFRKMMESMDVRFVSSATDIIQDFIHQPNKPEEVSEPKKTVQVQETVAER